MSAFDARRLSIGLVALLALVAGLPAEPVRVGLLIPTAGSDSALGAQVRLAAELAVARANQRGGFEGRPFELVVRGVAGPWGSGTAKVVELVFEQEVWAILGTLDGRSAHVAQQVVAKGQVSLVSPWALDPTLTQINVPWFFRCVPDDRQQAEALLREIDERGIGPIATVAGDGYDARVAAQAFARAAAGAGSSVTLQLSFAEGSADFSTVLDALEQHGIAGAVVYGPVADVAVLARGVRAAGMGQTLFGGLALASEELPAAAREALEGAVLVAPGHWHARAGLTFTQEFREAYGVEPSPPAAYAYDGMGLILEAIARGGLDRHRIRDALAAVRLQGVTGEIRFDERGNRVGSVDLMEIVTGRPKLLGGN
jgi:ABC-type branched-subunit amino acid transport system substrate-binding protein